MSLEERRRKGLSHLGFPNILNEHIQLKLIHLRWDSTLYNENLPKSWPLGPSRVSKEGEVSPSFHDIGFCFP